MSVKGEQLCRLCLKVAKKEFGKKDHLVDQLLDVLLLKLDLRIASNCIVCQDCIEVAKKCLNYKYTCIRTERIILSFSTGKETVRHSIKDVYKDRKHLVTVNDEYLNICRFCLIRLERNSYVPLGNMLNGTMSEMLIEYMPELDFAAIDTPIICTTCKGGLEDYVKFVLNCLDVEEKIKTYFMEEGADNMGWVKKKLDTQFWLKDILEYTDICPEFCKVNIESNIFEETECLYPEEYSGVIKFEKIGTEEDITLKEYSSKNQLELRIDTYDNAFPFKENHKETGSSIVSLETTYANIENIERTQVNVGLSSICDDPLEVKRNKNSDMVINDLTVSNVETKHRNNVLYDQGDMSVHKSVAKIIKYKCPSCPYETKRIYNFQMHMLNHKDVSEINMYKCSSCPYESKLKYYLKRHMSVHKDVSELKMHKCPLCSFEARQNGTLKKHITLIHKDVSEIKMYKCSSCPYEAKRKYFLNRHMLVHKDVSELKMHKCPLCSFEGKRKDNLNKHMVVHKDISEIKMYKCSLCTYEAKQNRGLTKHMLIHKDISEIQTYSCSFCAYVAKRKYDVTKHMLVHKDASELKMYKCPLCAYEAKRKFSLTKHICKVHKCPLCSFEARGKSNLNKHMVVHKDISEIKMYKCSLCTYEAKQNRALKKHMLIHKDISEVQTYNCSFCAYVAKRKYDVTKHMLVHKDASELKMYKCPLCAYETKRKFSLTKHMLIHKDVSEIQMHKC